MSIVNVTSEDGIEYRALAIPGSISFENVICSNAQNFPDGYSFVHAYVECEQVRNNCLPLDANPREPTRADVVRKMYETLQDKPEVFHHWNNGITIICESLEYCEYSSSLEICFSEGEGICNGGHTYFSIVTQPQEINRSALVHLELIKLPDGLTGPEKRQVITDIANRRNRNRQLLQSSQADHLGYYSIFKKFLDDNAKYVRWHEGDSQADISAIKSELFVRMLACLDPFWYSHPVHNPRGGSHKAAATSSQSIHNKWYDGAVEGDPEKNLHHMAVLSNDIFCMSERIAYSLKNDNFSEASPRFRGTNFYSWISEKERTTRFIHEGEACLDLPAPALVMMLGSFRSNIWMSLDEDGDPNLIGFLRKPSELWNEARNDYMRELLSLYEDGDRDPNQFIKQSAPYDKSLIQIIYGRMAPEFPDVFYHIPTVKKYSRSDSPTHYLICSNPQAYELHEIRSGLPAGAEGYVEVDV